MARALPRLRHDRNLLLGRARALALVALAGFAALSAPAAQAVEAAHHVLWSVQGRHNTVYLLGSIHVLRPEDAALPEAAESAYRRSGRVVMEIDLGTEMAGGAMSLAEKMQAMALLPEGTTLRSVLGADYASVAARAQQAGLDLVMLDRFAPWFVATTLLQVELAKRGFSPDLGVEQVLASRAAADHKAMQGLETAEQQFAILGGLPLPMQKRFLLMTLDESADFDKEIAELLGAWQAGDTAKLGALLGEEFARFPELYRPLTEQRNRAWIPQIERLLSEDADCLVVVGALHLVGHDSVVDLLRQRGYRITQL